MRSTVVLAGRVNRILSKLHPPSPPTSQEGQQLLGVLQSSFRRRLDEAHPPISKRQEIPSTSENVIPTNFIGNPSAATSKHLEAVLMHPLLGTGKEVNNDLSESEQVVNLFRSAVFENRMTANLVDQLITRHLQTFKSRNGKGKHTQLSVYIDEWLNTTSEEIRNEYLTHEKYVSRMIELMFCEGHEEMVWMWLRNVYHRDAVTASIDEFVWLRVEDRIVSGLIKQAIHKNQLEEALMQYVQACQYRVNSGSQYPLLFSWMRIGSAIVHLRGRNRIETGLFDAAMRHALPWSKSPETGKAMCMLYHPTNPTSKQLSNSLQFNAGSEVFLQKQAKASKASRKAMVASLLDGAQLALKEGSRKRATFLLDFAIDHYPDYLPARETPEIEPQLQASTNYVLG